MIETLLSSVGAITALVGVNAERRIGPKGGLAAGGVRVPAVEFERISTLAYDDLTSGGDIDGVRMQIGCWANTAGGARDLAKLVRGAIAPQDDIGIGTLAGKRGPTRDAETRDWGVTLDFIIMEERS